MQKINLSQLFLYTKKLTDTTEEYTVYYPDHSVIGQFKLNSFDKKLLSMVGYCLNLDEVLKHFQQPTGVES